MAETLRFRMADIAERISSWLADRLRGKSVTICVYCYRRYEKDSDCEAFSPVLMMRCSPMQAYLNKWQLAHDGSHYESRRSK